MLLAIDAGNTNIVFALFDGNNKKAEWRSATDAKKTADDFVVWLTPLFQKNGLSFEQVKAAIISSVVPSLDFALARLCQDHFTAAPQIVQYGKIKLNFDILLPHAEQLGADRIVNAAAVNDEYKSPAVIIDFGTATTFDILNADGNYIGGIIAPGPNLSLEALYNAAAKLPPIDLAKPARVMGTDTVSAMQSGVFYGYLGLIEGLLNRLQDELQTGITVISTGGLGRTFAENSDKIHIFDGDLTLKGLKLLHDLNRS